MVKEIIKNEKKKEYYRVDQGEEVEKREEESMRDKRENEEGDKEEDKNKESEEKPRVIVREIEPNIKIIESKSEKQKNGELEEEVESEERKQAKEFLIREGFVPNVKPQTNRFNEMEITPQTVRDIDRVKSAVQEESEEFARVIYDPRQHIMRQRTSYQVTHETRVSPALVQNNEIFTPERKETRFRGMDRRSTMDEDRGYKEPLESAKDDKPKRKYPWEI